MPGYTANDPASAEKLLEGIFKNVTVLDKSANDSFKNFESGNGDVAITYENQALAGIAAGSKDQFVIPPSTDRDPDADGGGRHERREALRRADRERLRQVPAHAGRAGRVPVGGLPAADRRRPAAKKGNGTEYPPVQDLFTADDLGGWDKLDSDTVFGPDGAFTKAFQAAKG